MSRSLLILLVATILPLSITTLTPAAAQDTGSISGTVTYTGAATGPHGIYVYAEDSAGVPWVQPAIEFTGPGSYPYTISNMPDGTYFVSAFLDVDGSGEWPDPCEPFAYNLTPVTISGGSAATGVDVALGDWTGSISGTVTYTGAVTEPGTRDVWILATDTSAPSLGLAAAFLVQTGPGAYTLSCVPDGSYHVFAMMDANGNGESDPGEPFGLVWQAATITGGSAATGVNIELVDFGSISGHVYQIDGVTAISGATVEAVSTTPGVGGGAATTGPEGAYTIASLPTGGYTVRASAPGYAREYWENVTPSHEATVIQVVAPAEVTGTDFSLNEGGAISGYVYQSDGTTQIAGATVRVWPSKYPQDAGFDAITAADGSYTVGGLSLGSYKVRAEASGYAKLKYYNGVYGWNNANNVMVTPPDTTPDINITLDPAGSISGHVYESDGETPIANVNVLADTTTGGWEGIGTRSNTDGSYTIDGLPPSDYVVRIQNPVGFASEFYDGQPSRATADSLPVAAGQQVTGIDFTLETGAPFRGHVYDEETEDPISGAQVAIWLATGGDVTNTMTLPDGSYELWVGTGCYLVGIGGHMMAPGYVPEYWNNHYSMSNADQVCVTAPTEQTGIDLYLAHAGSISGHVYLEGGTMPLPGANVFAFSTTTDAGAGANSQADGSYVIQGIPSGSYKVQATASGYYSEWHENAPDWASATVVTVVAPADTPGIDFTLAPTPTANALCRYDANGSMTIERQEAIQAVTDYLLGLTDITRQEAIIVITAYLLEESFTCS